MIHFKKGDKMKQLMTQIICLALLLLSASCNQAPQTAEQVASYTVQKVDRPLSNDEVKTMFSVLGLEFERFSCQLPENAKVSFYPGLFINGIETNDNGGGGGSVTVKQGLQEFFLFVKHDGDKDTIEFSVQEEGGSRIGCGTASLEGYTARTWRLLPVEVLHDLEQPLFIYAASNGNLEGIPSDYVDLDTLVKKYEFAMIIFASISLQ